MYYTLYTIRTICKICFSTKYEIIYGKLVSISIVHIRTTVTSTIVDAFLCICQVGTIRCGKWFVYTVNRPKRVRPNDRSPARTSRAEFPGTVMTRNDIHPEHCPGRIIRAIQNSILQRLIYDQINYRKNRTRRQQRRAGRESHHTSEGLLILWCDKNNGW